jgi:predicted aspartyl protease
MELPLRVYRLATVRGLVNGTPASFVVDTGGQWISISRATAAQMSAPGPSRHIPLKVYGTSGWDKDAFLMPNVDLAFDALHLASTPVVVLNLSAPSELLGFQVGGIVGHSFLSKYRVTFDLQRSILALD